MYSISRVLCCHSLDTHCLFFSCIYNKFCHPRLGKNQCDPNPCTNNGFCVPDANSCVTYTCQCTGCFTGNLCQTGEFCINKGDEQFVREVVAAGLMTGFGHSRLRTETKVWSLSPATTHKTDKDLRYWFRFQNVKKKFFWIKPNRKGANSCFGDTRDTFKSTHVSDANLCGTSHKNIWRTAGEQLASSWRAAGEQLANSWRAGDQLAISWRSAGASALLWFSSAMSLPSINTPPRDYVLSNQIVSTVLGIYKCTITD